MSMPDQMETYKRYPDQAALDKDAATMAEAGWRRTDVEPVVAESLMRNFFRRPQRTRFDAHYVSADRA